MVHVNDASDIISNSGVSTVKKDKVWSTQDAFNSCKEWITKCQKEHSSCRVSLPFFLPTRLVYVRGKPRVVSLDDMKSVQNYATLSHCWGSQTFLTLPKSTLEDFGRQIPSDALSKTFLDAILVCKQLGVDYIWIDSLCIIQDDPQDWQNEAGLMSDVYGHSYINIVASGAVDGRAGLFFRRSGAWRCRVKVPLAGGPAVYECVPFNMHTESIRPMPLSNRGWAVQERLLPHRSLLFTATEVFWGCNENIACERFPKSYPTELYSDYYSYSRGASRKQRVHEILWPEVVEQYSRCRLTFQRDKLVAISGVAREIQIHTRDQYVAGMWRSGLEQSLLWSTDVPINDSKFSNSPENPPCKAPSWSWVSVYNSASLPATQAPQHRLQVQVLDICIPPDEDPFGANSTARISLACSQMVMGHSSQDSSGSFYTDIFFGRKMLFRNIYLNFSQPNDIGRTLWLLPVLVNFEPVPFFEDDDITCSIRGLILRDGLGIEPGCYERIGFFVKEFEVSEHIRCRKDLDKFIEECNAEAKGIGGRDFSFSRLHCDENGIMRKVIILI
ncbi:HET domain containing protein [Hyaloscypha variabilis]